MVDIRDEAANDIEAVRDVNRQAFGREDERRIVDALREHDAAIVSPAAVADGVVVALSLISGKHCNGREACARHGSHPQRTERDVPTEDDDEGTAAFAESHMPCSTSLLPTVYEELQQKGATIRQPPTNFPWACEMQVEDPDGNVLRLGSESKRDQPVGQWYDMRGDRWTMTNPGEWRRVTGSGASSRG